MLVDLQGSDIPGVRGMILHVKIALVISESSFGKYKEALDSCNKIKDEFGDILERDVWERLGLLQAMIACESGLGNHSKSLELALLALKTSKTILGPTYTRTLLLTFNAGMCFENSKDLHKAFEFLTQAFALLDETLGPNSIHTKAVLRRLARFGGGLGPLWRRKIIKCSKLYLERTRDSSTEPDENLVDALKCLADDYFVLGKFYKARALQEEAIKYTIELKGEDHEDMVLLKRNLRNMKVGGRVRKTVYFWLPKSVRKI